MQKEEVERQNILNGLYSALGTIFIDYLYVFLKKFWHQMLSETEGINHDSFLHASFMLLMPGRGRTLPKSANDQPRSP